MPLFTPSRVAIVVLTLTLLTFLWSFGLPSQYELIQPLFDHDASARTTVQSIESRPTPEFDRPYVPPGNPRHTPLKPPNPPKPTPTPKPTPEAPPPPAPKPIESKIPEGNGPGDNKQGDVKDKQEKASGSAVPVLTLVTSALPPVATPSATSITAEAPSEPLNHKFCQDVHGAPNIVVIVKTSKAEIGDKLPTHLKTVLSCVPNFLIFSDHAGKVDDFTVHNVLDGVSNTTQASTGAFEEYRKMKQDQNHKPDHGKTKELDKFKILPMVYKAYQLHPHSRWYIFIEGDTSLSWTNLLQWVGRLDFRIPYYVGAPSFLNDVKFAQRGSGILLSHSAIKQYANTYNQKYLSEWEQKVAKECCGDLVLATALKEARVEFYAGFPLLQGETPITLDWSDRNWCTPAITWHHVSSPEINTLWDDQTTWTRNNGWEVPHLFRNAFDVLVQPHLTETIDSWDNLSRDTRITGPDKTKQREDEKAEMEKQQREKEKGPTQRRGPPIRTRESQVKPYPIESRDENPMDLSNPDIDNAANSAETCKHLCDITEDCLQWRYTSKDNHECVLGKVIRLGHKVDKKGSEDGFTSGWNMDKIKQRVEKWNEDCKEPNWRFNQ